MPEQITCPSCHSTIEITEALSSQLREQLKKQFDAELRKREKEFCERELKLAENEKSLKSARQEIETQKQEIEEQIKERLAKERDKLREEIARQTRDEIRGELTEKQSELEQVKAKLQQAQQLEIDLRKKARELDEKQQELELNLARQLDAERAKIRETVLKQADEEHQLKDAEKEKLINDLKKQIDELKRKSEQGSQQLQGEVMELGLEEMLSRHFPFDNIVPVPKGIHGGDVLQEVHDSTGHLCGSILWESKRTKNWSADWLPKLRDDQRTAKSQLAILVSAELPKGISTFCFQEGVWVTNYSCAMGLALALRNGLIEAARAKQAMNGQHGKMELLYNYLSGPEFRNRIEGIVEAFVTLKEELESEKRAMTRLWAKREKQLERAVLQTSGMYGDLHGIIGKSLPQIDSLALPEHEDFCFEQS